MSDALRRIPAMATRQAGRLSWSGFLLTTMVVATTLVLAASRLLAAPDARKHPQVDAHQGEVVSVRFVPERDLLISAGADGQLRAWNVPDLSANRDLYRFENGILAMDVSHDGFRVVASDSRHRVGLITLWGEEAKRPPVVQTLKDNDVVLDLAFMPGDARILGLMLNPVMTGPAVRLFEGRTLDRDRWFEPKAVDSAVAMAVDANATLLSAVCYTGALARWKIPQSMPARYRPVPKALTAVASSPDGGTVFMGDETGGLYIVTEQRKEPVRMWDLKQPVRSLALDAKGEWLAIGVGRPSRREIYQRTSLAKPWQKPAGAPSVLRLVSVANFMKGSGAEMLPDASTASLEGPAGGTLSITFSKDGNRLAVGGADGSIHLWRISDDKLRIGK